jgi:hypothetical protein
VFRKGMFERRKDVVMVQTSHHRSDCIGWASNTLLVLSSRKNAKPPDMVAFRISISPRSNAGKESTLGSLLVRIITAGLI